MKQFAALYQQLDASTSLLAKQAALRQYLQTAPALDAAWAVYFLAGGKPRQLVPVRLLRALAREAAGLPEWLFDECHEAVGDLAETIALLLPAPQGAHELSLADWMAQHLLPLRGLPPEELSARLRAQWALLAPDERLVYFKLITGAFRVGVSRLQVTQALAAVSDVDPKRIAQRLMGYTHIGARPSAEDYARLVRPEDAQEDAEAEREASGHPYPFFLAHPLQLPVAQMQDALGAPGDWQVEWKWDGIRAQLVRRAGETWVWSRGEELVSERFPELQQLGDALPDGTVIDGEIVAWEHALPGSAARASANLHAGSGATAALGKGAGTARGASAAPLAAPFAGGRVRPFADLQKRIGRKTLGPKILRELPVTLLAYDLLEEGGQDLRELPQHERRARLEALVVAAAHPTLQLSPLLTGASWDDLEAQRAQSRALGVEGMMLKSRAAQYGVGRTKDVGVWWKWKIDPFSVDAVLIYAQRGHGRRASLYTDYTFAVWDRPEGEEGRTLVPFAKAYSGLTDAEIAQVDAAIRKTTIESFGPVRSVRPTLVFELGFEGIARSGRHKSGIAVRFPRMLRWRRDKPVEEADTLQTLAALLPGEGP
ncbi:DNA ligase-1 [Oryzisolibacter propanilivorax]|uniref:DNA ligase (ATP) n=1 Tax=Oryzisolibacter propanilivorax TaxID=1527607 RepID=A0A1G9VR06_9BURK|nr:ATP-dependent DNA ligase [Oryzisolibacter propanilivorax]SDM74556.1 DNA ligase-1 [Oryzisolibacter propanilivorax]